MDKIIETDRLILRELTLSDTADLFKILSDKETMKHYPRPYTKEETKEWIGRSIKSYKNFGYGLWAVTLKKTDQFIGQCGISDQNIDGEKVLEIGYHINKNFQNNGFATEASRACLNYGFTKLGFDEIFIHTYIKNFPSVRVAQKIGMMKRKEYEKTIQKDNVVMKHVVYSLRKNESSA